jgi:hypothetical protein
MQNLRPFSFLSGATAIFGSFFRRYSRTVFRIFSFEMSPKSSAAFCRLCKNSDARTTQRKLHRNTRRISNERRRVLHLRSDGTPDPRKDRAADILGAWSHGHAFRKPRAFRMDLRRKGHGGQTAYRTGTLKDRCEPILLFEQCASDLCTRSRAANHRGDVGRGCRSCDQRHGRIEVSSIASREPEGKLRQTSVLAPWLRGTCRGQSVPSGTAWQCLGSLP